MKVKYSIGIVNGKIDIIRKKQKPNIVRIPKDAFLRKDCFICGKTFTTPLSINNSACNNCDK